MGRENKLTLDPQISHIRQKVNFLSHKLWPLLRCVSLGYRINLWNVFVRPMFDMLVSLYVMEGESNRERVTRLLRKSFKSFTLLGKNVDNKTVEGLMSLDFNERAIGLQRVARAKWEARKSRTFGCVLEEERKSCSESEGSGKSPRVLYPKEIQVFFNLKTALCPKCGVPCSSRHLLDVHRIYVPDNMAVLERCRLMSTEGFEQKLGRKDILENIINYIEPFSVYIKKFIAC